MTTATFDTYRFVERLEKAGMPREQAAAFAEAQKDSLAEALDSVLASKADIIKIERRIDGVEAKLDAMELRLTIKLGTFLALAVGLIAALIKL